MKKLIVCILSALCLFAFTACADEREPQERYTAYEIGHVTILQNAPETYEFRVEAEGAESIRISRSDMLSGSETAIPFTQENGVCTFDYALTEGDYFMFVSDGSGTAMFPFTIPKMSPRIVNTGSVVQILFEVDGATSWSSFIDPNGKNVYKSAKNVFDESAVAVSEDISITTSSVNDRDYDASAPYYYIVFEGKNGQMTYVSAALSDFDTEFSSVTASLSAGESGAVLTVAGTAKNAGYVAAAHSASGELVLGGEACDAGEFSVTCDLSQMTEPGIWYDVRLYNLYTGQRFDLASSCAQTSGEIEVGDRIYSFQVYDDLLKVTYSEKRGDASDVIGDLTMTLTAEDGTPYLTISGTAEEGIALSAAICTDNAQVVSAQNAGTGGTVSIRIDLSALTIAGRWYDLIITADGAEYDVYSSSASLNGQIYANGHIYNFQDWEGVVKVACDPT